MIRPPVARLPALAPAASLALVASVALASLALAAAPAQATALGPGQTPPKATRIVPFGEPVTVATAVLRASAIVLNPDEHLRSLTQPDAERWQVDFSELGPEGAGTPVITVTPTDCGLTTNLVVLTSKRVYPILLRSPPCDLEANDFDPQLPFDAVVRFRYPAEELVIEVPPPAPAAPHEAVPLGAPLQDLLAGAGRYSWQAKRSFRGPFPLLITDDGAQTYIVFRQYAWLSRDLPLFFLVNQAGERELANFDVEGGTFIVRTLFDQAALVLGGEKPKKQPYLLITRQDPGARP